LEYHHSIEQSAEYLRLALPLMGKQAAALHPLSYAIWYEYVANMNRPLREHIDALTRDGQVLDEAAVTQLFHDYVADIDAATARRVSQGFEKVMADVSSSTAQAASEAGQFGAALERWSADVAAGKPAALGTDNLNALLARSGDLQQIVNALHSRLTESQREIEQLSQEVERAREEALLDGLTGLANRRSFDQALTECLAAASDQPGPSLLMADIDLFKHVNDTYGHLFGDKVIRAIATILRENVKGKDLVARYGGEEFVVILPATPLAGAQHLAETLRQGVATSRIKRIGSEEVVDNVTISLGVACRLPGETGDELIARADAALYQSKQQGRNRVTVAG